MPVKSHSGWIHWLDATISPLKQLIPSMVDYNPSDLLETEIGEERYPFWHNTILGVMKRKKEYLDVHSVDVITLLSL